MHLTPHTEDVLREIIQIGVGRSAALLSEMIRLRVHLTIPRLSLCEKVQLPATLPRLTALTSSHSIIVTQDFSGGLNGRAAQMFSSESIVELSRLMSAEDDVEGMVTEVANIVLNGILGSMENVLHVPLQFEVPVIQTEQSPETVAMLMAQRFEEGSEVLLAAEAQFEVREWPFTSLILIVSKMGEIQTVLKALNLDEARN